MLRKLTKQVDEKKQVENRTHVTFIGDSTIDNRIWVDGLVSSYFKSLIGIQRCSHEEKVQQSHRLFFKPNLSVIEHFMDMSPNYIVHDFTNDGFTTKDCLQGQLRDKVFGEGRFSLFPHVKFSPLVEGANSIKQSQHIILSVGGNNFREFLMTAMNLEGSNRRQYIKENFSDVIKEMQQEYIEILRKIRELNSQAQIILMTQYYPSVVQNNYQIYQFMHEVGKILNLGGSAHDPLTVIHEIMVQTYSNVLKQISHENILVADITSSLDPLDINNHVHQIEPSSIGGRKIAHALKFLTSNDSVRPGRVYRFTPNFFISPTANHVIHSDLDKWMPLTPSELHKGFEDLTRTESQKKTFSFSK